MHHPARTFMMSAKRLFTNAILIIILAECILRITGQAYYYLKLYRPPEKQNERIRIVCLGESTTFGLCAPRGEDYPSQLQRFLDARYPGVFLVINRGVPGMTSSQMLLNLRRFLDETDPDLVVISCGANEFAVRLGVGNTFLIPEHPSLWGKGSFLVSRALYHLRLYRLVLLIRDHLKYRLVEFHGGYTGNKPGEIWTEQFTDETIRALCRRQFKFNMGKIIETIRRRRIHVVYTTYLMPAFYDTIREVTVRYSVPLCDLVRMVSDQGISLTGLLSEDVFHPNASGYALMGKLLGEFLENNGMLHELLNDAKKESRNISS